MTALSDTTGAGALRDPGKLGHTPARTALRMVGLTVVVGLIFVTTQTAFRHAEAVTVAEIVRAMGFHGVIDVSGSQLLLLSGNQLFWVDITPSCSSLGPGLALALIATIMSVGNPVSDRLLAGAAGVAAIVIGNMVRIGTSVIAGLLAGRVSLVLFHDWVGSTFGFAYTIGGFLLILNILLRRRRRRMERSVVRS
jgi:exosortase/archaeosortase family protein